MARGGGLLVCIALGFGVLLSLVQGGSSRDHLVGGNSGAWKIPSSSDPNSLTKWSQNSRFQVGDSLVWKYDAKKDSVLEVTRDAYLGCNTTNPISNNNDGDTKILLDHSGPYYFISGAESHCEKGQKLIVVVISPRRSSSPVVVSSGASPAPSPSLSATLGFEGPAVAPTSAAAAFNPGSPLLLALCLLVFGYLKLSTHSGNPY